MKHPPPIDTPVMVWNEGYESWKVKRYSTGRVNKYGNLVCFYDGRTSWSAYHEDDAVAYEHWEVVA